MKYSTPDKKDWDSIFDEMQPGDCLYIPTEKLSGVRTRMVNWVQRKHGSGKYEVVQAKLDDKCYRLFLYGGE